MRDSLAKNWELMLQLSQEGYLDVWGHIYETAKDSPVEDEDDDDADDDGFYPRNIVEYCY
jgi:hypothetical protein